MDVLDSISAKEAGYIRYRKIPTYFARVRHAAMAQ